VCVHALKLRHGSISATKRSKVIGSNSIPPLITTSRRRGWFPKEPLSVSIYESFSIDLLKRTNVAALGAPVVVATAPRKIHVNLAVATVLFVAVAAAIS